MRDRLVTDRHNSACLLTQGIMVRFLSLLISLISGFVSKDIIILLGRIAIRVV